MVGSTSGRRNNVQTSQEQFRVTLRDPINRRRVGQNDDYKLRIPSRNVHMSGNLEKAKAEYTILPRTPLASTPYNMGGAIRALAIRSDQTMQLLDGRKMCFL